MGYLGYDPGHEPGERGRKRRSAGNGARWAVALLVVAAVAAALIYCDSRFVAIGGRIFERSDSAVDLRGAQLDDLSPLYKFHALSSLDLRGCDVSAAEFDTLSERLPDCDIVWSVPLSFGSPDSTSEALSFAEAAESDFAMLGYFPSLAALDASGCTCYAAITDYAAAHPECAVSWEVAIGGKTYGSGATAIALGAADAAELELLQWLPALEKIDCRGCTEYEKLLELYNTRPDCEVLWTAELLGTSYDNTTGEIDISGTRITDFDALAAQLRNLPGLRKLYMFDCGQSNAQMDALLAQFPGIKFVWRVYFGIWSLRTDATVFSTLNYDPPAYRLVDSEAEVLKYCTDLQVLDLGHNSLTSAAPFAGMTELRVLILADNRIGDISVLSGLTKLVYLEMFINRVSDISVLSGMPELRDVNFCWNRISDPSVLYTLPNIERIWMCGAQMSGETKRALMAALPDCEFDLYSYYGSTNGTWRSHARFYKIRAAVKGYNGLPGYSWDDA